MFSRLKWRPTWNCARYSQSSCNPIRLVPDDFRLSRNLSSITNAFICLLSRLVALPFGKRFIIIIYATSIMHLKSSHDFKYCTYNVCHTIHVTMDSNSFVTYSCIFESSMLMMLGCASFWTNFPKVACHKRDNCTTAHFHILICRTFSTLTLALMINKLY